MMEKNEAKQQSNPWKFLSSLNGKDDIDRKLIELTRQNEVRVIRDLVASSRASILYAHSGNGKSSIINAGLVPFFTSKGYAVFETRPRPPWSTENPSEAFKESIIRNIHLPKLKHSDLEMLQLMKQEIDPTRQDELNGFFKRWELKFKRNEETLSSSELADTLRPFLKQPLTEFVGLLQDYLSSKIKIIVICDQFEELFVHYANTPEMEDFISALGAIWANDRLKVHFLFSLREDWVGSMIALKHAIPEIFSYTFKLSPLKKSQAANALRFPLKEVGFEIENDLVKRLTEDLAKSHSINQSNPSTNGKLNTNDDSYIELPALQIVADKLWETQGNQIAPFSLDHYAELKDDRNDSRTSPTEYILSHYLDDFLNSYPALNNWTEDETRELRIDLLYLLTDRIKHRRALPLHLIVEEVNLIRPRDLQLQKVNEAIIEEALVPLISDRLVKKEKGKDKHTEYELAHDFAVRSVVNTWHNQDKRRTKILAIKEQEDLEKDKEFERLKKKEVIAMRLLQFGPLIPLITILTLLFAILGNEDISYSGTNLALWIIGLSSFSLLPIGIMNRQRLSIANSALFIAVVLFVVSRFISDKKISNTVVDSYTISVTANEEYTIDIEAEELNYWINIFDADDRLLKRITYLVKNSTERIIHFDYSGQAKIIVGSYREEGGNYALKIKDSHEDLILNVNSELTIEEKIRVNIRNREGLQNLLIISVPFLFLLTLSNIYFIGKKLKDKDLFLKVFKTIVYESIDFIMIGLTLIFSFIYFILDLKVSPLWMTSLLIPVLGISLVYYRMRSTFGLLPFQIILGNHDGTRLDYLRFLGRYIFMVPWFGIFIALDIGIIYLLNGPSFIPHVTSLLLWLLSVSLIVRFSKDGRMPYDRLAGAYMFDKKDMRFPKERKNMSRNFTEEAKMI